MLGIKDSMQLPQLVPDRIYVSVKRPRLYRGFCVARRRDYACRTRLGLEAVCLDVYSGQMRRPSVGECGACTSELTTLRDQSVVSMRPDSAASILENSYRMPCLPPPLAVTSLRAPTLPAGVCTS